MWINLGDVGLCWCCEWEVEEFLEEIWWGWKEVGEEGWDEGDEVGVEVLEMDGDVIFGRWWFVLEWWWWFSGCGWEVEVVGDVEDSGWEFGGRSGVVGGCICWVGRYYW